MDFTTSLIKLNNQYTIVGSTSEVDPTTVPKKGELYFELTQSDERVCKIGDGVTALKDLPTIGVSKLELNSTTENSNVIDLHYNGKYKLEVGGKTINFKMPAAVEAGEIEGLVDTFHEPEYTSGLKIGTGNNVSDLWVPKATDSVFGVVKPASVRSSSISTVTAQTASNRYYGVELDTSGKMFVNVPWVNTNDYHIAIDLPQGKTGIKIAECGQGGLGDIYVPTGTEAGTVATGDHTHTITASATDGIFNLTGTSGIDQVTYKVEPYTSKQTGKFDTSSTNPTGTTRLNWGGYLYATKLYSNGIEVATLSSEQALTNKTYNGYTLGAACAKGVTDSSGAGAISTGTNLVTERDVYYGLPKINNSHSYTSDTTIYAPVLAGTSGYILKSNGGTLAPTWIQTVPISNGGTGAVNAATARTNLGAASIDHFYTSETTEGLKVVHVTANSTIYNNRGVASHIFRFKTSATGDHVENARFNTDGHFIPGTTATYNLGTSDKRWKAAYTSNFYLSNTSTSTTSPVMSLAQSADPAGNTIHFGCAGTTSGYSTTKYGGSLFGYDTTGYMFLRFPTSTDSYMLGSKDKSDNYYWGIARGGYASFSSISLKSPLAIANGGTGATTAAAARTALGVLALAGGSMTGPLNLLGDQYSATTTEGTIGALNANNSSIIGVDGIYISDHKNACHEGIHFPRSSNSNYDTFYCLDGVPYIVKNRTKGSTGTATKILTASNFSLSGTILTITTT